jgi:hypothetical protein
MTLGGKIATADDLVLALYRASSELPVEEFQRAALELIKPLLAFDSGWWGSGVMTGSTLSIHALHLHDMSPDAPMEYREVAEQDPTTSIIFEHGDGVYRFHASTVFSDKKASLEFRHLLKNHNVENMLNSGTLNRNNGFASWISLFRANPDQDYSDRDQHLMQILLPHLYRIAVDQSPDSSETSRWQPTPFPACHRR